MVYPSDGSMASVQAAINQAEDGDTITLPAGTFSWTQRVNITKGITLQGQTTISGAGTATPTCNDLTIVKDDVPRAGWRGIISVNVKPSQSFRMTGITFEAGAVTTVPNNPGIRLTSSGASSPNSSIRVDHCHFKPLYVGQVVEVSGWIYGVGDHNVFEFSQAGKVAWLIYNGSNWGGPSQIWGNGSWADYPWYGTEKFFFVEDSTFIRAGNTATAAVDSLLGGRFVWRHNYHYNCIVADHGTEGAPARGCRVKEIYDNVFDLPRGGQSGSRSGTTMIHDNVILGHLSNPGIINGLGNYRETVARPNPVWGIADGTSVWDANDTEGNGTFVEGHAPFLFASGTAASAAVPDGHGGYVFTVDGNPSWATDRWRGYSIKNPDALTAYGSYITHNTANTITYSHYADEAGVHGPEFAVGARFQIHRVLAAMDQCGSGKGDQLTGARNPINTVTRRASYNHQALEPCFSWNNVHTPSGHALGFGSSYPTEMLNRDYYNLGGGFPVGTIPPRVSSTYTVALNGVDYVGPFVYPHPLVSSASVPTDVNGDGKPDYLLYNRTTQQTVIWYLNNDVLIGHAFGPTPWFGWSLVGVADFNGDGKPDYLLYNPTTGQTAIWYLNNDVLIGHAFGPTLWSGWSLVAP